MREGKLSDKTDAREELLNLLLQGTSLAIIVLNSGEQAAFFLEMTIGENLTPAQPQASYSAQVPILVLQDLRLVLHSRNQEKEG